MLFGTLQQRRPKNGTIEQLQRPRPHLGSELSAGEQKAELIFGSEVLRHGYSEMTRRYCYPVAPEI